MNDKFISCLVMGILSLTAILAGRSIECVVLLVGALIVYNLNEKL